METLRSLGPSLGAPLLHLLKLGLWLVFLTVIFAPLERLFALHPKTFFRKEIAADLGYYFLSSLVPGILLGFPLAVLAWGVRHLVPAAFTASIASWPFGVRLVISFLVGEVGFYWGHRWSHESSFLWRFHAVHHSAEHLDFLVNTRTHPVDMVFTRLCGLVPLYILGLASPMRGNGNVIPLLVILLGTIWGFFVHANLRWRFGLLEWLIATPAFHHWHHTNDGAEVINKNYAAMLPVVDRLFGTLYLPRRDHPVRYGIDEPVSPFLSGQLIDPLLFWRAKQRSASRQAPQRLDGGVS